MCHFSYNSIHHLFYYVISFTSRVFLCLRVAVAPFVRLSCFRSNYLIVWLPLFSISLFIANYSAHMDSCSCVFYIDIFFQHRYSYLRGMAAQQGMFIYIFLGSEYREKTRIEQKRSYFFLHFSIWNLWTIKGSRVSYMLKNIHIYNQYENDT